MTAHACDACLRRTWLVARLGGAIETARRDRRPLREILALSDQRLLAGLGRWAGTDLADEMDRVDIGALRDAATHARLAVVCRHGEGYPARLRDLPDGPAALFVAAERDGLERLGRLAGGTTDDGARAVAIVGTRRASAEGNEVARALGRGLGAAGLGVVSGMALGIDSAAHGGALDSGAPTLAVLAGGADVPYPASKRSLYRRIVAEGCVVSEMPPGFTPFKWCFPARNRIIAALAQMTVVVEAAERSGSLITAEIAADVGREIGAVPGPVTSWRARGTNALLRDGATLVRDTRDVLDAVVGVEGGAAPDPAAGLEPRLASLLRSVADGRDTLAALAGAPDQAHGTLAALTELELLGHLRRVAGGRYVVVPRW
ncbi:MAG: processing protein [Solirubrobacteraceae bacterium]|jgi:DNA processing protein|nr:processing protein [Solirubrobacteraceae bacterium]